MIRFLILLLCLGLMSCQESVEQNRAQEIVDKAIENAGGDRYRQAEINFVFRQIDYRSKRNGGWYELSRSFNDSLGDVMDVLDNNGFKRIRNGVKVELADSLAIKFANSVNGVHYFVQLPFGLNDGAVVKKFVGKDTIQGEPYYEIGVTFKQEGGGADHEDEYLYWIHQDQYTVNFLAYRFYVEEGGIRFRKAYNPRSIEGLRFTDYSNYKYSGNWQDLPLEHLDELFEARQLEQVSEIRNEDIRVTIH